MEPVELQTKKWNPRYEFRGLKLQAVSTETSPAIFEDEEGNRFGVPLALVTVLVPPPKEGEVWRNKETGEFFLVNDRGYLLGVRGIMDIDRDNYADKYEKVLPDE